MRNNSSEFLAASGAAFYPDLPNRPFGPEQTPGKNILMPTLEGATLLAAGRLALEKLQQGLGLSSNGAEKGK